MFNSVLSNKDLVFEISTYLYHDEMRNLKLAFSSIILNKNLYSERKEKYKLLIDNIDEPIAYLCQLLIKDQYADISKAITTGTDEGLNCDIDIHELYFPPRIFGDCVKTMYFFYKKFGPRLNIFKLCVYDASRFNNTHIYFYRNSDELEKYLIDHDIYPSNDDNDFYAGIFKCDYLEKCIRKNINNLTNAEFYNLYESTISLKDVKLLISYFSEEEKLKLKNSLIETIKEDEVEEDDDYHKLILEML